MNWIDFADQKPKDGQRVLVFDNEYNEVRLLYYNDYYNCWDDEQGDDTEFSIEKYPNRITKWMCLPKKP